MVSPLDVEWSGIFPSLCTPFAKDGSIDEAAQAAVVRFVLACRAHGIVCGGLAGEVNRITPDERKRVSEVILAETGGRVPVLVGVGAEAEHTAIDLARHAECAGADGIVIPPPVTTRVSKDVLAGYFLAIAGSTELPVMVQDAPAYLGVALSPDFVARLADRQPNIRYVKVESGPEETAHWVSQLGSAMGVFTGDAGLHLLGLQEVVWANREAAPADRPKAVAPCSAGRQGQGLRLAHASLDRRRRGRRPAE